MVKGTVPTGEGFIRVVSAEIRQRPIRLLSLLLLLLVSVFLTSDTRVDSTNTQWTEQDKSIDMNTGEAVFIENHSEDGCQGKGWNSSVEGGISSNAGQSWPAISGNDFRRIANSGSVAADPRKNGSFSS